MTTPKPQSQEFVWKHEYTKVAVAVFMIIVLGTGGMAIMSFLKSNKEIKAADSLYKIEKDFEKRKEGFAKAEMPPAPPTPKKEGETQPEPPGKKASGDLGQDYGDLITQFETVIKEHPGTQASLFAALNVAGLQSSYKKIAEALETLGKVDKGVKSSSVLGALVLNMKASLLANSGDCKAAIRIWEPMNKEQALQFMHEDFSLRLGLCHESLGDLKKAEELYTNTANNDRNSVAARAAQKYLRILKSKLSPAPQAG
ncbi:MAG: tol-pal system YbgF family protein [Pseudobdellovibrionaceae bacterium]